MAIKMFSMWLVTLRHSVCLLMHLCMFAAHSNHGKCHVYFVYFLTFVFSEVLNGTSMQLGCLKTLGNSF